jgi:hypothetical protein
MAILKNKPIKNNTDIIGFLLTITNIPDNIEVKKTKDVINSI